jgi:predicted small secreted protein
MRRLIPVLIITAFAVSACEPKPKTPAEKAGAAIEDIGDSIQDAAKPKTPIEKAGDKIKDATH